jgi:tetratricopeptide (TPR) repeat protein
MMRLSASIGSAFGFAVCFLFPSLLIHAATGDMLSADKALQQGRADEAAQILSQILAKQPANAVAHLLLCRVYYSEDVADMSVHECEHAASLVPDDSNTQMWLGRAYGLKASDAGPFSGLSLAKKVRLAFERSAQLNPTSVPALTALGEFYIAAPALVGGGLDKAERVANQLQPSSLSASHRLLAMIAEKRKDMFHAEAEFKAAVMVGKSTDAWVDLGNFYQRQNKPDQAVAALHSALDADRTHGPAAMDIASILTDAHRSPDLAEKVLRLYLASSAKSEEAPAFKIHYQLGQLLASRGDQVGAQHEYAAALQLASSFAPARKAIQAARL